MRRAGLIAAGALGVVLAAGVVVWLVALRDTTEPVSVEEAVTSFRTDTAPTPGVGSPIPAGVYVYATRGFERTDALTGVTHRYPRRSTITVAAHPCGASLTWRVLRGRSTEWVYCVADDGWELRSQDERHAFFGRIEATTYVCDETLIRPRRGGRAESPLACATDATEEHGSVTFLGAERLAVGGRSLEAEHVRKRTWFTGAIRGSASHDLWFDSSSGLPVKLVLESETTNDSPIGDVRYVESVTLRLNSLEPRR